MQYVAEKNTFCYILHPTDEYCCFLEMNRNLIVFIVLYSEINIFSLILRFVVMFIQCKCETEMYTYLFFNVVFLCFDCEFLQCSKYTFGVSKIKGLFIAFHRERIF